MQMLTNGVCMLLFYCRFYYRLYFSEEFAEELSDIVISGIIYTLIIFFLNIPIEYQLRYFYISIIKFFVLIVNHISKHKLLFMIQRIISRLLPDSVKEMNIIQSNY